MSADTTGTGTQRLARIARVVNLLVPGAGIILVGREALGVLVALLFTAAANAALAANLLFPAEWSPGWRAISTGVALGTYLGAQVRFAQTLRDQRRRASAAHRNAALRAARAALLAGRVEEAWRLLQPLAPQAEDDLLLAYRLAQVLSARGDRQAARAAWQRVRRLDRHRIYYREVLDNERALSEERPGPGGADETPRRQA